MHKTRRAQTMNHLTYFCANQDLNSDLNSKYGTTAYVPAAKLERTAHPQQRNELWINCLLYFSMEKIRMGSRQCSRYNFSSFDPQAPFGAGGANICARTHQFPVLQILCITCEGACAHLCELSFCTFFALPHLHRRF